MEHTERISMRMARSVMRRYRSEQVKWHYEHGLVLQSVYALGTAVGSDEYITWVQAMYDTKINADGSINTYKKEEFNLDQINPGKTLFDLYHLTGDEKYRKAIELLHAQLLHQPRTESSGFWHKKIYPHQMWLDGLYMQGPFYARYALEFGSPAELQDLVAQLVLVESKTRDAKTGLMYHAWDESRRQLWANPQTGCSPHFWGRAMGWYCMAVVDTLDFIPAGVANQAYINSLIAIGRRLTLAVIAYQDAESSLWFQILDQGKRDKNYLETSASSMFVYFLFKMLNKKYFEKDDTDLAASARLCARSGYDALVSRKLSEDASGELHLNGICSVAGLGGNPYRDGSYEYYVKEPVVADDFKGVGPFILASLEAEAT
ncbi:glycoside hydrolase family 88 protein [Treponema sp.]